jgi:hypothetical protein
MRKNERSGPGITTVVEEDADVAGAEDCWGCAVLACIAGPSAGAVTVSSEKARSKQGGTV